MNLEIRPATPDDRPAMRSIYLHARRHAFAWMPAEAYQPGDLDAAIEGEQVLVATHGQRLLGFVSWWEADHFIHCLFIDPAVHGQGIGTLLLSECLARVGRPAELKCVVANRPAMRFYLARGWQEHSRGSCEEGEYALMQYQ